MASKKNSAGKRQGSPVLSDIEVDVPAAKKKRNIQSLPVDKIMAKLDEIQKTSVSLKQSVQQVEQNVSECRDTIKKSIDELKSEFQDKFTSHDSRITDLESRASALDSDMKKMNFDQEKMYVAINKLNLILIGLDDHPNEQSDQLYDNVIGKLRAINSDASYEVKKVFRIGRPMQNTNRPIKIIMRNSDARDALFDGRKTLPKPLFLCEDLPYSMRSDQKQLLKMKHDALAQNPKQLVMLHLHKRQIIIGNKQTRIVHGQRYDETLSPAQLRNMQPRQPEKRLNPGINDSNPHPVSREQTNDGNSMTLNLFRGFVDNNATAGPTSSTAASTPSAHPSTFLEQRPNNPQPSISLGSMNPWMK